MQKDEFNRIETPQKSVASLPKWQDLTSYTRHRPREEQEATSLEIQSGPLRIVITCAHTAYRGCWVMHCHGLNIDTLPLPRAVSLLGAKHAAVEVITKRLEQLSDAAKIVEQTLEPLPDPKHS